jgi:hypothetical protein
MPTIGLSQLLPAFTLLRSARNSGLRDKREVLAMPAAKLIPRRTHAFDQFQRPDDPKRHTDGIARLKTTGKNRVRAGVRVALIAGYYNEFRILI